MSSSSGGAANNADVVVDGNRDRTLDRPAEERPRDQRTSQEQEYLDAIAEADGAAVAAIEQQIRDLQQSLKDRKAEAKKSQAAARGEKE